MNSLDILKRYPLLGRLLHSGVLTKKILRTVLQIDKWEADTLHGNMVFLGMIRITNSVMFRVTPEFEEILYEMEENGEI